MAEPVLERDLQDLKDLEVRAAAGDEAAQQQFFFIVSDLVKRVTKWQWVIHGETLVYRQRVIRWLVRSGRYTQARRFAMCGRGDVGSIGDGEGQVRIRPMGCGARFCPRCSRRYGRRFLARVAAHLSSKPHGELSHLVLTQRVLPDESLADARERFEGAWKKFYRVLRGIPMVSALATYHVTPSSVIGWHYHCHLVMELGEGVKLADVYEQLDDAWFAALGDGESQRKDLFRRLVSPAGPAMAGLAGDRQMEFWDESPDPVEVVLQYVLRDILQGVEGWIGKMATDEQAESFAKALSGAKLHRLYGVWRTAVVEGEADEVDGDAEADEEDSTVDGAGVRAIVWQEVGGMDEVLWKARQGTEVCLDLVRRLLGRSSNRGAVALRLWRLVQEFAG